MRRLVLWCWPFFPETVLFIPVFARVLILVVFTEFLPNFSKNSIKQCSLSATAREWQQIFEDEYPEQLHTTLPLAVTTTVCGAVPEKLVTMKAFLESDVDAERESVGWRHIAEAVDFKVDAFLHKVEIWDLVSFDFNPDCSGLIVNSSPAWHWTRPANKHAINH